ncbi:MAG TPA: hypothetical protein VGM51_09840 [Armatimonadota bacterium]
MSQTESVPTLPEIETAMNSAWKKMEAILPRVGPVLDSGPNASGWTPRELLSHMVGAWQRVPMHTAFFRDSVDVPVQVADPCWTPEWATAPISAFQACLEAGYDLNKAFLSRVKESELSIHGKPHSVRQRLAIFSC